MEATRCSPQVVVTPTGWSQDGPEPAPLPCENGFHSFLQSRNGLAVQGLRSRGMLYKNQLFQLRISCRNAMKWMVWRNHGWVSHWMSAWMHECISYERMPEYINSLMHVCMHACINGWRNEGMKEWRNEGMKEWRNEGMNEGDERMHGWMNEWINQQINGWLNEWINCINEWMIEGMSEWVSEWVSEWLEWVNFQKSMNQWVNQRAESMD